ncbi:MAG: hypothetical protein LBB48_02295 [Treponema sp.]|nr:hypothetical protein [Treponema sp.]
MTTKERSRGAQEYKNCLGINDYFAITINNGSDNSFILPIKPDTANNLRSSWGDGTELTTSPSTGKLIFILSVLKNGCQNNGDILLNLGSGRKPGRYQSHLPDAGRGQGDNAL